MENASVLVIDDEIILRQELSTYLEARTFATSTVGTLRDARDLLAHHRFDVVLMEMSLSGEDSLSLLRELVARKGPPVVVVSKNAEEADRVATLEIGAADFMMKPFSFRELLARIRNVLRHTAETKPLPAREIVSFDRWSVDLRGFVAIDSSGYRVQFTTGEMAMLRAFLAHPRRILERAELLALTNHQDGRVFPRTIDVLITRIRRKLERNPRRPEILHTIRNQGYRFDSEVSWERIP